jgi:hypothetical protein
MTYDYWFYQIGVNVLSADTVKKIPIEEWVEYQNQPVSPDLFERNIKNGLYNKGIALIPGKIWRGPHKDKYLVFLDLDNQIAINEVCKCFGAKDLEELSRHVIVEQHKDDLSKAHLYFYSDYPFKKKSSDAIRFKDKIENNEIPAIEVKGLGEHGIAFCSPSLHKNGYPYEIIGTKEPKTCGKVVEDLLFDIYKKYELTVNENSLSQRIPIQKLFEDDFVILEGHNRHEGILRAIESLIYRNKNILSEEKIKELSFDWNQKHCDSPLDNKEFEKQWNSAKNFLAKNRISKKDESPEDISKEQENAISKILKSIKERYIDVFTDQLNEYYITLKINDHIECVPFKSNRFKNIIRKEYFDQEKQILSDDKLDGILKLIESQLMYNSQDIKKIDLNLRVAKISDSIYYDLTNPKWEIIKITSEGWDIINNNEKPIFKRYEKNCSSQVYPSKDYNEKIFLNRFLKLFNLKSKNDILLISIYIISLFIPDIPKCILVLSGAGGGAKTTTFELIKKTVDPGAVDTFSFPKQINDLIQTLAHNYVNFFDNVTFISAEVSDLLCRAVTGAGFSKRALFSNDDDFIYKFNRPIGINGINLATTRADFLDRSLIIKLNRIEKKDRRKKEDIDREFEKVRPFVLGYIMNTLVKVLKYKEDHKDEKILYGFPRMADFAEWGEIIARCMGYDKNAFINAYYENISAQNDEVIESSPVAEVLILFVKELYKDYWEGTPTRLYKELTDIADQIKPELKRSNLWPKASNKLTSKINEVEPNLKEKGIEIITGEKDSEGNRIIKVRKLQKNTYDINGNEKKQNDNDENNQEHLFNSNIHRIGYSDIWECDNCRLKGDIHFMKQHICTKN